MAGPVTAVCGCDRHAVLSRSSDVARSRCAVRSDAEPNTSVPKRIEQNSFSGVTEPSCDGTQRNPRAPAGVQHCSEVSWSDDKLQQPSAV